MVVVDLNDVFCCGFLYQLCVYYYYYYYYYYFSYGRILLRWGEEIIQKGRRTGDPYYKKKKKPNKRKLSMKQSFPFSQYIWEGNSSKKIMCFTPNKGCTPNLIPQNLLVWKFVIEDARIMLQPNTTNRDRMMRFRWGFAGLEAKLRNWKAEQKHDHARFDTKLEKKR